MIGILSDSARQGAADGAGRFLFALAVICAVLEPTPATAAPPGVGPGSAAKTPAASLVAESRADPSSQTETLLGQLETLLGGLPETDFGARIESAARAFLGAGYATSPLGEGSGVAPGSASTHAELDPDPRLRLDRFDCTTFVETVAALALSTRPEEVQGLLDQLRYSDSVVSFDSRHHLPVAQWLPAQQRRGLLADVTADFAEPALPVAELTVHTSPEIWRDRSGLRELRLAPERVPAASWSLPFLKSTTSSERSAVVRALESVNEPLLLNVVREPRDGVPLAISHQALLLPTKAAPAPEAQQRPASVVHASSWAGAVIEVDLAAFLEQQARRTNWALLGVNLQQWRPSSEHTDRVLDPR